MPCFHPIKGYRSRVAGPSGKRKIVFDKSDGFSDLPVQIPCGQCIGCRLERSRQWAIRCSHEASLWEANEFITLTYNDANMPFGGSLQLRDFQLFMKRLRKKYGSKIRFYHCGEYGEQLNRPHYHACLFNFGLSDRQLYKTSNGHRLYTSDALDALWINEHGENMGFALTGDVTYESAAYVARYITKKITGDKAENHYEKIDPETGEIYDLKPEYTTMSRRPGIGHDWLKQYPADAFPRDMIILHGKKMKPPKYYDRQYELNNSLEFRKLRNIRKVNAKTHHADNTPQRLSVREICQVAKLKNQLPRNLEKD